MTTAQVQKSVDLFNQMEEAMGELSRIARDLNKALAGQIQPTDNAQILAIQNAVCLRFDLPLSSMTDRDRHAIYVYGRQIAMFLCRKHTKAGQREIAQAFGKEDHGTVAYAKQMIQNRLDTDKKVVAHIAAIEARLIEDKIIPCPS